MTSNLQPSFEGDPEKELQWYKNYALSLKRQNRQLMSLLKGEQGTLLPARCYGASLINGIGTNRVKPPEYDCAIKWDEMHKRFYVNFLVQESMDFVHQFVNEVAEKSNCSCGLPLYLTDYSVGTASDGKIEFQGIYICKECEDAKPKALSFIKKMCEEVGKFVSIKISADGFELKKQSD